MKSLFFSITLLFTLTGCGYVGPILPPLLDIPMQIPYVNIAEYGDKIIVEFAQPDLTTEGNPIHNLRLIEVRVGPPVTPLMAQIWERTAKAYPVASPAPGAFTKEIPIEGWLNQAVLISVRAVGAKGRPASWANLKFLKVEPPLAKPSALAASNAAEGVKLTWQGSAPKYRIFRAIGDAAPERIDESAKPEFIDATSQYDKTYKYQVQALTDELHLSEISASTPVTTKDEFPPAVPGALTAIVGVSTVELAWTRSIESDFRGYNVYRSTDGGPFVKIGELVVAPTFSDKKIEAGKKYRYEVSAVDTAGNESPHSTPAEASNQ